MSSLIRTIAVCAFFLAWMNADVIAEGKGQSMFHELNVNGNVRSYILYRPAVSAGKPLPLMIVLHGGLGNAGYMERTSEMDDVADNGSFLVAYPDGTGGRLESMKNRRTWNAGRCCGQAVKQDVDDVSFIQKMIDDINARYLIDTRRVYVAGHSNGAMLAYRVACEIPDKIAAVIAVSGTLAVDSCDGAKDVPVLHIHGDQDRNIPFGGGMGEDSLAGVAHRSVPDTITLLTRARGCAAPEHKTLNGIIETTSYTCKSGAPVLLYVIKGGGHPWPGGAGRNNTSPIDGSVSASKLAWEFAQKFQKQ